MSIVYGNVEVCRPGQGSFHSVLEEECPQYRVQRCVRLQKVTRIDLFFKNCDKEKGKQVAMGRGLINIKVYCLFRKEFKQVYRSS